MMGMASVQRMYRQTAERETLLAARAAFWIRLGTASLLSRDARFPKDPYELAHVQRPESLTAKPQMSADEMRSNLKEWSRLRREAAARGDLGH